jgi:hypothetical protein
MPRSSEVFSYVQTLQLNCLDISLVRHSCYIPGLFIILCYSSPGLTSPDQIRLVTLIVMPDFHEMRNGTSVGIVTQHYTKQRQDKHPQAKGRMS